jgi:MFS family permease
LPAEHRPFVAVLGANVISVAGDSVTQLGVPWYVLESTGSSARAGVVAFCALLPVAVSAWASDPFIDWVGRRRISIISDLATGASVAARGVLLPALADRAGLRLVRAASLYDGASRCASMVGAAVGGVLIIALGASRQGSFGEGLGFLLRAPLLLGICLTSLAAQGLDQGWSSVLLPDDVLTKLGSVLDLGMLETVFAVCALAGALLYGALAHRWRRRSVFAVAFLIVGAPRFAVAALTGTVAPLAVMMAVEGLACGALNPIRATVVFETVPEHLRSRVISTMTAAGLMAAPFGGLVAGVFVGAVGLSATLLVTAGVYLAVTLWPVTSTAWRDLDPG